ncbi:alpha/beta hydrolase family esterase [Fimbriiglobus ruber]|uniref:LpqC n=1 Tax=Fimbriiglobus ruber TaxID=1908690 RepID=A0A225DBX0_9BACT|nr:PHB depolymerase family esterase [Fimbriiglobus ruber]OWK38483.1 LpqC [Fimbriiglobus ruber]
MIEGVELVTLLVSESERRYLLYRPPGAADGEPRPAIVFLHGTGGTADWADGETGWSAAAARENFILAIPEGAPPDPAKPPKFLTNPPRWNDGSTRPNDPLHSNARDVEFLTAVIADIIHRGPVDPLRVSVTGFSNGAGMTFRLAAERAELLAAVVPVAGHCWVPDPRPAVPVPTLYIIGDADPLIPLHGGTIRIPWGGRLVRRPTVTETLEKWAHAIGCSPVSEIVSDAHGIREERYPSASSSVGAEFRALFVAGLGHHWPGGKGQLNPRIGGPPSARLDATARIWAFFQDQRRV